MKKFVAWGVVVALLASIGYSVVLANQERRPAGLVEPAALCRVTGYNLTSTGGAVTAMVVCGESGRYKVSATVDGAGEVSAGSVTVKLSKDLPSMVTVGVSPAFSRSIQAYEVRFLVEKD